LTGRQWDFDLALPAVAAKSAEQGKGNLQSAIRHTPSTNPTGQQIAANELGPESGRANLLACFPLANFGHFDLAKTIWGRFFAWVAVGPKKATRVKSELMSRSDLICWPA